MPGTNAYAILYKEFLSALADHGNNIVGFDPRGHGRSGGVSGEEFSHRIAEFKAHYWKRFNQQRMSMDKAVRRYIAGIRKNRLYILDSPQLRFVPAIKAISDSLYRLILRREAGKHLAMIRETLEDMRIWQDSTR